MKKGEGTLSNIKLGTFVITGTLLFILSMYYIGDNQNIFSATFKLKVIFNNVNGLQKGNNIRYAGIDVGTVNEIEILNDTSIMITMVIENKVREFIKKDAMAVIGTDGLMGNMLINIRPGNPRSPVVEENDTLMSLDRVDSDKMLRRLGQTNTNIELISDNLLEIIEKINKGKGNAGRLLNDSSLALELERTIIELRVLSQKMVVITKSVEKNITEGKGTLGMLLTDTALADSINSTVRDIASAGENINKVTHDLKKMISDMQQEEGLVHTLMTDTAMAGNLERSLKNIENGTEGFNENMEALKHNFLFRGYFRKLEKKKAKE